MNNQDVLKEITSCETELIHIQQLINGIGLTSSIVPYLTKYAIIKSCGTIEYCFKTVIADYCSNRSKKQVKQFINRKIKLGSANPSLSNIKKLLKEFDDGWSNSFKSLLDSEPDKGTLILSLDSLVSTRNSFAHGGNPTASISDVITYFSNSKKIIEILDTVVR